MFEEEAEEWRNSLPYEIDNDTFYNIAIPCMEFGYNKANEWHWIKDGDFPEEEKEYLIYTKKKKLEIRKIHISGDGKNYLTDVFLMRDLESVIAWKEIVPPELEESEL